MPHINMKLVLLLLLAIVAVSGCISYSEDIENAEQEIALVLEEIDISIDVGSCWKTEESLEVSYFGKYAIIEEEINLYFKGEPANNNYIDILEKEERLENILLKEIAKKGFFGLGLKKDYEIYGKTEHYIDLEQGKFVTKSGEFLENSPKKGELGKEDWRPMFSLLLGCYDLSECSPKRNARCVDALLNDSFFVNKLEIIEPNYKKILNKPFGCWTDDECKGGETCISRADSMWLYGKCKEIKKQRGIRNPVKGQSKIEEWIYSTGELTANSMPLLELYVDDRDIIECDSLENQTSAERLYCGIARFAGVYDVLGTTLSVLTLGHSTGPVELIDGLLSKIKIFTKQRAKQSRSHQNQTKSNHNFQNYRKTLQFHNV